MPGTGCVPPKSGGCIKHCCLQKWGQGCVPAPDAHDAMAGVSEGPVALQCVTLNTVGEIMVCGG